MFLQGVVQIIQLFVPCIQPESDAFLAKLLQTVKKIVHAIDLKRAIKLVDLDIDPFEGNDVLVGEFERKDEVLAVHE